MPTPSKFQLPSDMKFKTPTGGRSAPGVTTDQGSRYEGPPTDIDAYMAQTLTVLTPQMLGLNSWYDWFPGGMQYQSSTEWQRLMNFIKELDANAVAQYRASMTSTTDAFGRTTLTPQITPEQAAQVALRGAEFALGKLADNFKAYYQTATAGGERPGQVGTPEQGAQPSTGVVKTPEPEPETTGPRIEVKTPEPFTTPPAGEAQSQREYRIGTGGEIEKWNWNAASGQYEFGGLLTEAEYAGDPRIRQFLGVTYEPETLSATEATLGGQTQRVMRYTPKVAQTAAGGTARPAAMVGTVEEQHAAAMKAVTPTTRAGTQYYRWSDGSYHTTEEPKTALPTGVLGYAGSVPITKANLPAAEQSQPMTILANWLDDPTVSKFWKNQVSQYLMSYGAGTKQPQSISRMGKTTAFKWTGGTADWTKLKQNLKSKFPTLFKGQWDLFPTTVVGTRPTGGMASGGGNAQ